MCPVEWELGAGTFSLSIIYSLLFLTGPHIWSLMTSTPQDLENPDLGTEICTNFVLPGECWVFLSLSMA